MPQLAQTASSFAPHFGQSPRRLSQAHAAGYRRMGAGVAWITTTPARRTCIARRPALRLLTATEGRAGLALARERRPDMILLDLHLRDMAGEAVLHAIRAEPALARTAVIIFTAEQYPRLPERLRVAGAQAYLMKPVVLRQLFDVVDAECARRRSSAVRAQ